MRKRIPSLPGLNSTGSTAIADGINHVGIKVEDGAAEGKACKGLGTEVKELTPKREAEYRVPDPDCNPIELSQHGWPH